MKSRNYPRISVHLGNFACVLGTTTGAAILYSVMFTPRGIPAFIVSVVGLNVVYYFTHCLIHFVVGTVLGIRFKRYELGRSSIRKLNIRVINIIADRLPTLTLRIDFATSPKRAPLRFFAMHSAGSIAAMVVPVLGSYFVWSLLEEPFRLYILLGNVGNIGFELYSSSKVGDMRRALTALEGFGQKGRE